MSTGMRRVTRADHEYNSSVKQLGIVEGDVAGEKLNVLKVLKEKIENMLCKVLFKTLKFLLLQVVTSFIDISISSIVPYKALFCCH